jgi:hypothetical protein
LHEVPIAAARRKLSALGDQAREVPVFRTRRRRAVAAIVDLDQLKRLGADAYELADIRAADAAWQDADKPDEMPIPWDHVSAISPCVKHEKVWLSGAKESAPILRWLITTCLRGHSFPSV